MAIVAFTAYNGSTDCGRTNDYICDGHGAPVSRTNRYISDGHGQATLLEGYNCPADPVLATQYMKALRLNYENQHPSGGDRAKSAITHQQIYVSPTEEDNVPAEERMVMIRELIERTVLRDFASIYTPHDNTPDKHGHISICPYSIPDENGKTHKLCMNNTLLNNLRREMDYICVEHGYSIVENRELWGDKAYREWFLRVKEEGAVKIHPPRVQDRTTFKKDRKRSRSYAASKQSKRLQQEKQATFYRAMTRSYSEKSAELFYTPAYLYDPSRPDHPLHIRKHGKSGVELSELEQASTAVFVWAYQAANVLRSRNIPSSGGLQRRMRSLADKAFNARNLIHALDIRTHAELIAHIKECGSDIAELKQDIARQNTILRREAETPDAKKQHARTAVRKAFAESLLEERKAEYRHLKETEAVLHPASSRAEWHAYLETLLGKEAAAKIGFVDEENLEKHLHQMGRIIGITSEDVERLISSAKSTAKKTTWMEYRAFVRIIFTSDDSGAISAVYDEIRQDYHAIRTLHGLADDLAAIGPLFLLLTFAIAFYAGMKEAALERDIEELKWEAEILKEYSRETQRIRLAALRDVKNAYDAEDVSASKQEIAAAQERFYQRALRILDRIDGLEDTDELCVAGTLDQKIKTASRLGYAEPQDAASMQRCRADDCDRHR